MKTRTGKYLVMLIMVIVASGCMKDKCTDADRDRMGEIHEEMDQINAQLQWILDHWGLGATDHPDWYALQQLFDDLSNEWHALEDKCSSSPQSSSGGTSSTTITDQGPGATNPNDLAVQDATGATAF